MLSLIFFYTEYVFEQRRLIDRKIYDFVKKRKIGGILEISKILPLKKKKIITTIFRVKPLQKQQNII